MTSLHFLREDIKEVFNIFDEDASGSINIQEVTRALYTITGERVAQSEVLKLIAYGRDAVTREQQRALESHKASQQSTASEADPQSTLSPPAGLGSPDIRPQSKSQDFMSCSSTPRLQPSHSHQLDSSEGIDMEVFEQVVLRKLQHRSYEEELAYTFALLEDSTYAGFITKESVRRAAAEAGEPLTEAEIVEMFDTVVTGAPTAAVDLSAFIDLQLAARKAEDS
ncbi:putative caltractin [Leptomonas pyrrhocoris]|uniref:Putative caltractin n=1 Tax=Leptomonas pyrrhocoris TaxID=157538 RepID=A0A0N1J4T8_LEPPY|nr:putative caltractin [Leptomonas pyrrhocoris]XP_015658667.1 putative caltractin [Leptomonas pyrrhocoris]KPA80227.1 putative caltractin [Leptomonas pyrrhocoris]KPA80228.1 putative caltractin [Leptomonas pyrrhocoris]|eukprot:XP_015658666.1 putative caltractin [Leptomonas pyrrhocoris]